MLTAVLRFAAVLRMSGFQFAAVLRLVGVSEFHMPVSFLNFQNTIKCMMEIHSKKRNVTQSSFCCHTLLAFALLAFALHQHPNRLHKRKVVVLLQIPEPG